MVALCKGRRFTAFHQYLYMYMHTYISQNGWTALHLAAQEGHEDVVELLLEAKADPDPQKEVINS